MQDENASEIVSVKKSGGGERAKSEYVYFVNEMLVMLLCLSK